LLTELLQSDPQIEVIGTAHDPLMAREKIKQLNPDVLTLDVQMPKMDGVTFLRNLMRLRPMPVVMVSTLTEEGADITLEALSLGAVDFVAKPKVDVKEKLFEYQDEIIAKVKTAAQAKVGKSVTLPKKSAVVPDVIPSHSVDSILEKPIVKPGYFVTDRIVAIGASTGGTEAIMEVLKQFPADFSPVVITQHIPPVFSESFAKRLDSLCPMKVLHAEEGQEVVQGHAYVAPGDKHLIIRRSGSRLYCSLNDGPPVNRHKPSVDVMFRSVLQSTGGNCVSVILTGMGADGAQGMKDLHDEGAFTIAQDQDSSIVWGMPGEAVKMEAVDMVLPLLKIPAAVIKKCK
jgi:two-component system chemotaxis response regulator CheB